MQAKTDYRLVWAVQLVLRFVLLCTVFHAGSLAAQCTLSCPSGLNLSIAGPAFGCESTVRPVDIGVVAPSCSGLIDLDLYTSSNQLLAGDTTAQGARVGKVRSVHIGQQLRARVTHRASGNNCDINLTIRDGQAPQLSLNDTVVSVLQDLTPVGFGGLFEGPLIEDCTQTTTTYLDSLDQGGCNSSAYAKTFRTWTVTDAYSNSQSVSQEISQIAISLDSILAPIDTTVSCVDGIPTGVAMGVPQVTFGGLTYHLPSVEGNFANLFWSYEDESFAGGGGTAQLLRSFRFYDVCSPAVSGLNPRTLVQRIAVVDTVAPVFNATVDTLYYPITSTSCDAAISLPALPVADDCTVIPSVSVQLANQFNAGNGGPFDPLGLGNYAAVYTATDSSGNSNTYSFVVVVRDQNPPVLITRSNIQVSLSSAGVAIINATAFDQGSYDDCTGLNWGIRLVGDTDWSSELIFDCISINETVGVELRLCDDFANCNIRSAQVNVFDYLPPIINKPLNLTLDCSVSDTDSIMFGQVHVSDNCLFKLTDSISVNRDACGVGQIERFWFAQDSSGNQSSATQVINFEPTHTFTGSDISWPRDTILSPCESTDTAQLPMGYSGPTWATVACSDIAVSYEDQVITGPSGVCAVLFRDWTVIDQCSFDGLSAGVWEFSQRIEIVDQDAPIISAVSDSLDVFTTVDSCSGGLFPANFFSLQDCSALLSTFRFYSNGLFVDSLTYSNDEFFIHKSIDKIELLSVDNCGNRDSLSIAIDVIDQSPPIALCADTLVHYLNADTSYIDLEEIDLGSQDACGGSLFARSIDFIPTCDTRGWNRVALTVTDSAGLQDVCFTEVEVVDSSETCPIKRTTVVGKMATVNDVAIPTRFDLVGLAGDTISTFESAEDGTFAFDVTLIDSVTVIPSSNFDPKRFVSTYDLYLIGQHILGITEFEDPLKRFAGDANKSRTVSAFDMTLLRRLFLELSEELPHGESVRFIPDTADLSLPDLSLTPGIPIYAANSDSTSLTWHAIKLGDVSGTRSFTKTSLEQRSTDVLPFEWKQLDDAKWSLDYAGTEALELYGLGLWVNGQNLKLNEQMTEGALLVTSGSTAKLSWLAVSSPLSLKPGFSVLTVFSSTQPTLKLNRCDAVARAGETGVPAEFKVTSMNESYVAEAMERVQVYPNPAKAGTMLRVASQANDITSLRIVDARGNVTEIAVSEGSSALGLLPRSLAPGIYALQGRYVNGRTFEQRILVSD